MMMQELSYQQLKASNEARVSEEQRSDQRKRNILLLILQYLKEERYLNAAQALNDEAGVNLRKFDVCDNIDLPTIVQEYESYYYIKFNKWPNISKRVRDSGDVQNRRLQSKGRTSSKEHIKSAPPVPVSFPTINGSSSDSACQSAGKRPSSDTKKKITKSKVSTPAPSGLSSPAGNEPVDYGLTVTSAPAQHKQHQHDKVENVHGKKVIIDFKSMLSNAIKGPLGPGSEPCEKLVKPLAGFAGISGEWRDLAAVVSRDIYLENPNVRWDDIIGLDEAKRLVKEAVVYPIRYPQLFTGILSPWKGLLLYGPPGTGKTLLAKAVATECNTTFFNISASTIVSKWRGDSEKLVRVLFELARFHAPSTIFLDELDSLMSQRGSGGGVGEHEGSRRMKTELLVQMDGLSRSDDLVFLLAASNLPWELDHAMLRRLEKRILVGLPTVQARKAMLEHLLPPTVPSSDGGLTLKADIDYDSLAKKMDDYSGSDIRLVCKEAAMRPIRKIFDILEGHHQKGEGDIRSLAAFTVDSILTKDVESALERTKPSARTIKVKYEEWQKEFESV